MIDCIVGWLIGLLVCLVGWLDDGWLVDCGLVVWLLDWLVDWLLVWLVN